MSFTPAPPMPTGAPKTGGVSCYLRPTKRGLTFTLYFSAGAQEQVFGGSIVGRRFLLGIGRGSDEGKLQIMAVPDDSETAASAFVAGGGVRGGGASIKCGGWDLLPRDKRPGSEVKLLTFDERQVLLMLPSWARPSKPGGALDGEFALKPVPRAETQAPAQPAPTAPAGRAGRIAEQAAAMGRAGQR